MTTRPSDMAGVTPGMGSDGSEIRTGVTLSRTVDGFNRRVDEESRPERFGSSSR